MVSHKKNLLMFITSSLLFVFLWQGWTTPAIILEHLIIIWGSYSVSMFKKIKRCNLNLTLDEIYILEELAKGKQQKEIRKFSKNTVTKKLKQARIRNKLTSTAELMLMYREMLEQDKINPMQK